MNKREFIKKGLLGAGGIVCLKNIELRSLTPADSTSDKWAHEALFYKVTTKGVQCLVCPNRCMLRPGDTSVCHNKINKGNKLYTIAYGNPCAVHIDPIEKKPLMHFLPGTYAYSIATAGCNLACLNCQNWQISQVSPRETENTNLMPQQVVDECIANNNQSIAYTYSEPIAFYEYTYETSKLAKAKGIKNLLISNGYVNEEPLRKLCKVIDAANINLKSFSEDIYQRLNSGSLQPILNTLKVIKEEGVWLEITNLIVPTWTDDLDMIKRMCEWLVKEGFSNVPLHFSRFNPMYRLTQLPATPLDILISARDIAMKAGCKYVYIGNVPLKGAEDTVCPNCKRIVIERKGFRVLVNNLIKGNCKWCGASVPGIWA